MSGEERESGWLGTTDDMDRYAHGKFDTLKEAVEKGASVLGVPFRYIWVGLRNEIHVEIGREKYLLETDEFDAEHSLDTEERESWEYSAAGHRSRLEWLNKLAPIFDVPLESETEDDTLQCRVLKSFTGEETVKSIAGKLKEDENKIRMIVNRLIKAGDIQATGEHVNHFKKYVRA